MNQKNIEIKNKSEALCYQTKKQLEELSGTATPEEKEQIEGLVTQLEEAIQKEDYPLMEELMEKVQKTAMEVGTRAYSEASNDAATNEGIDTDFTTEK